MQRLVGKVPSDVRVRQKVGHWRFDRDECKKFRLMPRFDLHMCKKAMLNFDINYTYLFLIMVVMDIIYIILN